MHAAGLLDPQQGQLALYVQAVLSPLLWGQQGIQPSPVALNTALVPCPAHPLQYCDRGSLRDALDDGSIFLTPLLGGQQGSVFNLVVVARLLMDVAAALLCLHGMHLVRWAVIWENAAVPALRRTLY